MLKAYKSSNPRYKYVTLCSFQGTIYAFACDTGDTDQPVENGGDNIVFNVLALNPSSQSDAMDWSGFRPVSFPTTLRPVGMSLIEVDAQAIASKIAPEQTSFRVVSDDTYLYIFRQSKAKTLLVNRLLPSVEVDPKTNTKRYTVSPAWEVRYRDSGKVDIPANDKDMQSYTNADSKPFLSPTIELYFVKDVEEGKFNVVLINGATAQRWHIFKPSKNHGEMVHYSLLKNGDAIFDLTDQELDDNGFIQPTDTFKLQRSSEDLPLQFSPATTLATLREPLTTANGETLTSQKGVRLALAQVVENQAKKQMAFLDIGVSVDGQLNSFPAAFELKPIAPANYAFDFDQYAYVSLPNNDGSLAIHGSFRFKVWVKPKKLPQASTVIIGDDKWGGDFYNCSAV